MNLLFPGFGYLLGWLRELRVFTYIYKFIKPDEEIHRVGFGRVPSVGASVPTELGQITLPVHGLVHPPGSSQNLVLLRFLLRLPHVAWSITNSISTPIILSGGWRRAENSKLLIMAWFFQWSALIQKPTQSHLIRTKDTSITQEATRVSAVQCQELGGDLYICHTYMIYVTYMAYIHFLYIYICHIYAI